MRVLVIDDEPAVRRTVREMLERHGYEVAEADNGRTGLAVLETFECDLVVTDIIMPEMEGLETVRTLRQMDPELPIVAISGGGRITAMDPLSVALSFGATRVLHKPFAPADLLNTVREVLST